MRIVVTGGTGFVGSHSVKSLSDAGHSVKLLVRSPDRIRQALDPLGVGEVEHVAGDVTDVPSVERALQGADAVLHCASVYSLDPRQAGAIRHTNVTGTENVISAARRLGLDPIVHVSSVVGLSGQHGEVLSHDSQPTHPRGYYSASKAESDRVARRHQDEGAPVVITYPASVFGPHDPHWGESAILVGNALRGYFRMMPAGSLPISDVRDLARLHVAVMEPGHGPRRYMGLAVNPDTSALMAALGRVTGRTLKITRVPLAPVYYLARALDLLQRAVPARLPLPSEGIWYVSRAHSVDDSLTRRDFGIEPLPLDQTLEDMIRWMVSSGRLKPRLAGKLRPSGPSA